MSERQEASRDAARLTKNSGRGRTAGEKGDARYPEENSKITIDYKEANRSFTLNDKVLAKVNTDAMYNGDEFGMLKIIIGQESKTRVFIVQEDIMHEMLEAWIDARAH